MWLKYSREVWGKWLSPGLENQFARAMVRLEHHLRTSRQSILIPSVESAVRAWVQQEGTGMPDSSLQKKEEKNATEQTIRGRTEERSFSFWNRLERHLMCRALFRKNTFLFHPAVCRMTSSKYCLIGGIILEPQCAVEYIVDVYFANALRYLFRRR